MINQIAQKQGGNSTQSDNGGTSPAPSPKVGGNDSQPKA
jgi:hypothetical protein